MRTEHIIQDITHCIQSIHASDRLQGPAVHVVPRRGSATVAAVAFRTRSYRQICEHHFFFPSSSSLLLSVSSVSLCIALYRSSSLCIALHRAVYRALIYGHSKCVRASHTKLFGPRRATAKCVSADNDDDDVTAGRQAAFRPRRGRIATYNIGTYTYVRLCVGTIFTCESICRTPSIRGCGLETRLGSAQLGECVWRWHIM